MKNKHLLLIFLLTLLLGLAARYTPWFKSDLFSTDLISIDSLALQRISITLPGQPELLLERSDEGWVASQDALAVRTADSCVAPVLRALAQIHSRRIVHSSQRDTLSLSAGQAIHVEALLKNGRKEVFEIGREIAENKQPATFIEIDRHEGIYLADHYLRRIFNLSLDNFRTKWILALQPGALSGLHILTPGVDTLHWQKIDTARVWIPAPAGLPASAAAVDQWLKSLLQLNGMPFADHFDENHGEDYLATAIELDVAGQEEPVWLHVYKGTPVNSLEAKKDRWPTKTRLPEYVVQSSQNPYSYFVLSDTVLLHKIMAGPLTVPD